VLIWHVLIDCWCIILACVDNYIKYFLVDHLHIVRQDDEANLRLMEYEIILLFRRFSLVCSWTRSLLVCVSDCWRHQSVWSRSICCQWLLVADLFWSSVENLFLIWLWENVAVRCATWLFSFAFHPWSDRVCLLEFHRIGAYVLIMLTRSVSAS
jgi:hypothetical protein